MSVALVIRRLEGSSITLEEWKKVVAADNSLRIRTEPYVAVNPKTGMTIRLPVGEADTEIKQGDQWLPFLRFQQGRLVIEYRRQFDDPENPERRKIAQIATLIGAVIGTDASDSVLAW